jgi:hypothetical protein
MIPSKTLTENPNLLPRQSTRLRLAMASVMLRRSPWLLPSLPEEVACVVTAAVDV